MNPVAQAIAAAHQATHRVAGVTVRYRRGDVYTDLDVAAVPSANRFEESDHAGLKTLLHVRDYLILAANVVFENQKTEPEAGDVIEEVIGDQVYHFEVMSPGGAASAWNYRDTARSQIRLHTKLVATEALP
ncbi:MAG: hypothetical protein AAGG38_09260 [Planctomycetota bacterium]